jgi:hypothetical protein
MENSIDSLIVYGLIPSAIVIFIGYYIYGWYAHRILRDKHFKEVEKQLKLQTIYLEKLASPIDEQTRLRIEKLEKTTVENEVSNKQTPV